MTRGSVNYSTIIGKDNINKKNIEEKKNNQDIVNLVKKDKSRLSIIILITLLAFRNPKPKVNKNSLEDYIKTVSNELRATNTTGSIKDAELTNKQEILFNQFMKKLRTLILLDINKKESYQILEALYSCDLSSFAIELIESDLITIDVELISLVLYKGDIKFFILFSRDGLGRSCLKENEFEHLK